MNIFYKVCVWLLIIGGVNWGLMGLFNFDAVAWLLGGSAGFLARTVYTIVGVAAICAALQYGLCCKAAFYFPYFPRLENREIYIPFQFGHSRRKCG